MYEDDANGKIQICYITRGESVPEHWEFEKGESFAKSFKVVGIITGRGTVPLFRVTSNVKINAQYYVDYVLNPLFTVHLPRLYPNEMDKVYFHHDKASSHTANFTAEYLVKMKSELGISFTNKDELHVKAPDCFGFGYLKQRLSSRRARTLDGIWKLSRELLPEIVNFLDRYGRKSISLKSKESSIVGKYDYG